MRKRLGWLWVVATLGFSAAAMAQTPPASTAGTRFDGTYGFVSSTKLTETYTITGTARIGRCGDRGACPLKIVNGQARFSFGRQIKFEFEGGVGPEGKLAMRLVPTPISNGSLGIEMSVSGRIDGNGTVSAPPDRESL